MIGALVRWLSGARPPRTYAPTGAIPANPTPPPKSSDAARSARARIADGTASNAQVDAAPDPWRPHPDGYPCTCGGKFEPDGLGGLVCPACGASTS